MNTRFPKLLTVAGLVGAALLLVPSHSFGGCGCMDVAFVVDTSGSMQPAIDNVKTQLTQIVNIAQYVSGGDLRMGLVTFPNDDVEINVPFTTNLTNLEAAINALVANGGAGEPESSDEALQFVITGAPDPSCTISNTTGLPFGSFRSECVKIAVLITDAHPGECADVFTPGVSDVNAHNVALAAADAGILIASIYVPTFGEQEDIKTIMQDYALTSGGSFVETQDNGGGTGEGIADIVASCGIPQVQSITRNSRYWFTHAYSSIADCATLLNAIQINGSLVDLGFVTLPTTTRTAAGHPGANDALIEALGFYWRGNGKTGEDSGTQNRKLNASSLCRARKQLAVELLAATANVRLLGTSPTNAFYNNGVTVTNFPADLLQQARTVAAGYDPAAINSMKLLLRKFNSSGLTNDLPNGLVECTPVAGGRLKSLSRDATTQQSCPGAPNGSCTAPETVYFTSDPSDPFASAVFARTVNLTQYLPGAPAPSCGVGGRDAIWRIPSSLGTQGRQFTVTSDGSNFDTMLSAWSGDCTNLTEVTCTNALLGVRGEHLTFTTDGSNTFWVVGQGPSGQYGKMRIRITSP